MNNELIERLQKTLKKIGILRLVLGIFGIIVLIILAITVAKYSDIPESAPTQGTFVAREGETETLRSLLEDIQKQKGELGELRRLIQQRATAEVPESEYKSYVYKEQAILAKIISDENGVIILQSKDNEYYLSINGVLYKMPRLLYIVRVVRTAKYWLAVDDLGVTYVADDSDYTVKYLDIFMDDEGVYQLKNMEGIENLLKQVVLKDGTIYRQLPNGVEIIYPDGTRKFIEGAVLKETKDGIGLYDKDGNLIEKLDNIISASYVSPRGVEAQIAGMLNNKPIYRDARGFYYLDEDGNKHYLTPEELMDVVEAIDSAQLVGTIRTELGDIPLYKDAKGYFYIDENGNKHYVEMTPELLDKMIEDNGGVYAMVDGKVRKIMKDENGYYYIDEQGNKRYVPFEEIKDNLVGTDVYIVNHDQFIKSKLTDAQKKALDKLGEYEKIEMCANGDLYVQKNGKIYKVDKDGNTVEFEKGELFIENNVIKIKTPDGKVIELCKSINIPKALVFENGQWYGIDEYGNRTAIDAEDVARYLEHGDYILANIDGKERKLFKNDKGFFYLDENGNKVYVDDEKVEKALKDSLLDTKGAQFLGQGMEFIDKDGNRYIIAEDGSILKIAPDGTVTNLGKGKLYALKDGSIIFEDLDGNRVKLGELDRIKTADGVVYKIGDRKYGFNEKGELIEFGPGNKLTNLGKGEIFFDEEGNLMFRDANGNIIKLGKPEELFTKGDLLSQADKIYGEKPIEGRREDQTKTQPTVEKKEEAPPSFLGDLQERLGTRRPSREEEIPSLFGTQQRERQATGMSAIIEAQPIASLDYTKILSDDFLKSRIPPKIGEVQAINIPGGTEFSGYLMFGILAPAATYGKVYDSYAFIKVDKDVLLKNGINIGTYDAIITAQTRGDLVSDRAMLSPLRITFFDPNNKRSAYYEGEINYADLDNAGGSSGSGGKGGMVEEEFVRGTVLSEWDGLEGLPGLELSKQDEMIKLAFSSSVLGAMSDIIKSYANPYAALIGGAQEQYRFENTDVSEALRQGVLSGFGDAFKSLMDFQLQLSQNQIPVIAVKGGNMPEARVRIIFPNRVRVEKYEILEYNTGGQ